MGWPYFYTSFEGLIPQPKRHYKWSMTVNYKASVIL